MKLVIAIVQDQDVAGLLDRLVKKGYKATKLASTGGFLRVGNTTLLVGVNDDQVQDVVGVIKDVCKSRTQLITPMPAVGRSITSYVPQPVEVKVGGATIFVVDVAHFEKI
ncbi:MAG TPA: hypothetical protein GXX51_01425 [Firmicutes bacterium]|nr:hypothetical protein [Bacillota bacterium]